MLIETQKVYWCLVNGSDIFIENGDLPFDSAQNLNLVALDANYIGQYKNHPCYWLNTEDIKRSIELVSLRSLLLSPQELFLIASKAAQLSHMTQTQRFCSICGGRNYLNRAELAMQCFDCRTIHYPRIYPCIIVAVRHNQKILLAQHAKHQQVMYTVLAGFVEVGETLEQCVAREVKEESGIEVQNIRYFGSQPWAFPSSLMVAFTADYLSGDIKIDKKELSDAAWFSYDNLPPIAPEGTIARALIEHFRPE